MQQTQFKKRHGASNVDGILYQITLLTYLLYDALKNTQKRLVKSFHFANKLEVGKFECVGLKYDYETINTDNEMSKTVFLQTKFNQKKNIYVTPTQHPGQNISLLKTFHIHRALKKEFETNNADNPIFCGNFSSVNYVFFTNASVRLDNNVKLSDAEQPFKNFDKSQMNMFSICDNGSDSDCFTINTKSGFAEELLANLKKHPPSFGDSVTLQEVKTFLEKVFFFTNQCDEPTLENIIKEKLGSQYCLSSQDVENKYHLIENAIQNWWETGDYCLDTNNRFIQDSLKVSFHFNVKEPYKYFSGRAKEHESILNKHFGSANNSQVIVVCGSGGLGKTELAKKFIKKYGYKYDHNIIWINALEMSQSFNELAFRLNIPTGKIQNEEDDKDTIQQIYDHFNKRKCLFVFDNVVNKQLLYEKFLPLRSLQSKPFVLITSRERVWPKFTIIGLKVLLQQEAVSFVCRALKIDNSEEIKKLVLILHRYPLILRHAISYMQNTNTTISQFTKHYGSIKHKVLDYPLGPDEEYMHTAYNTWNITMNQIERESGELPAKIFNLMAYIAPTGIPRRIFSTLANEDSLILAIRSLLYYSMINNDNNDKSILSIHEVIQQVFRIQNKLEEENLLKTTLSLFGTIDCETVNHAMYAWKYATRYKSLIQQYSGVCPQILEVLFFESRFTDGYNFGREAIDVMTKSCASDETLTNLIMENVLKTKKTLGKILLHQSRFDDSIAIYNAVLDVEKNIYPEGDEHIFFTKNSIGIVMRHKGLYEDVLRYFEPLLESELKFLGPDHPITLSTKDEIAKIYELQGKYKEALDLNLEIKKIKIKHLLVKQCKSDEREVKYDEFTLTNMDNIATVYNFLGMYEHSEEEFKEIMRYKEKHLSENDPSRSKTVNNLGVLYIRQGKFDEALTIFERRLEKLKEAHNSPSVSIIIASYNISLIHYSKCDYNTALPICEEILNNSVNIIKDGHMKTLQIAQLKGDILMKLGRLGEAMEIFQHVIRTATCETMETLQTRNSMGCVLLTQGKLAEALKQFNEVLSKKVALFGEKHPETFITEHYIGRVYKEQGNLWKALSVFKVVYEKRKNLLGDSHPQTVECCIDITKTESEVSTLGYVRELLSFW